MSAGDAIAIPCAVLPYFVRFGCLSSVFLGLAGGRQQNFNPNPQKKLETTAAAAAGCFCIALPGTISGYRS